MAKESKSIGEAELGHRFDLNELARFTAIYGVAAWPAGKSLGFAVVVGMIYPTMYLLAEYEARDIRDLVYKCGALNSDFRFQFLSRDRRWYRSYDNPNAAAFVREMNEKNRDCPFSFYGSSDLSERDEPYAYLLPKLRGEYLKPGQKRLLLKDSKVQTCLSGIEDLPESTMKLGEFPAIEAVAIAAIELQREADRLGNRPRSSPKSAWNDHILTRGMGNRRNT